MTEIDEIRELLQQIQADTPNFIRTGIPENVKSDRVRSLHLRNNEAVQRMLDLMDEDTGTGSVLSGVTNPNQTPPPGNYTVGSYYIQRDAETSGNVALYQYTGIDGIGWWRFENYQNFQTVYGEIPDPNAEPPSGDFQIGDYYVNTTDGTHQGDVLAVWFKISTTPGLSWILLGESPSFPEGTRALLENGDDTVLRVWSAKVLSDWLSSGSGSSFTGIKTSNTVDIELSGNGTQGDPLKGVLTQSVKDDIAKGVTAYESGSPGETPTLQEVIAAGNTYEIRGLMGVVEGALGVQGFKFTPRSTKRSASILMTEQDNIEKYTVFSSEGVVYEHNGLREKIIAFPFGVQRQGQFSGEKIPYFPLSINGEFADEFGAVLIPETMIIPISNGNVEIGEVFGHRFLRYSKLVGFELLCEDAPTGDSIGVNLLINDSTVDTVYIPDSETLSEENLMGDSPLEVYRGDKVSFDVFGIGSNDPGTNLKAVLKVIENSGGVTAK